jgi:hypothetical protein
MVEVQSWWHHRLLRGWSGFGLQEFSMASSIRGRAASRGHGGSDQGCGGCEQQQRRAGRTLHEQEEDTRLFNF